MAMPFNIMQIKKFKIKPPLLFLDLQDPGVTWDPNYLL